MNGLYFYDGTFAQFAAWAEQFCQHYPRYQHDGKPAMGHILNAAHAEGYTEINSENIAAVQAALIARAKRKA